MGIIFKRTMSWCLCLALASFVLDPATLSAQKMKHSGSTGRSASAAKSRPATGASKSINGGSQKAPDRKVGTTASTGSKPKPKPTTSDKNKPGAGGDKNRPATGDKTTNIGGGNKTTNIGGGNKVNIDNSKTNININVDNSRNTVVRHNSRPYGRPPYVYGGHRYYCYHPYHYHPYRPYYWGPVWHPWGFFVATMAATAIIVSVNNQQYHYDQGVYYVQSGNGYTVVQAPVGATITTLPPNSQTVVVNETTNNYYYGGTYYEKSSGGYTVVAPTAGTVVENLPEGGEEVKIGDQTYVKYGETYYQPIQKDGKSMYEVVNVEDDKK